MPKFSIIIPVYNVEDYIGRCLDSLMQQTYKDYEVIIINDGTKDKSIEIAKKYPYKIISQENQGLSEARNNGVKYAQGEYIIFLDSDDYWEKDLLKELEKSTKNDPDIIRFQIQEVDGDEKTRYEEEPFKNKNGEDAFGRITKYHFVENAWCYAIKRSYYNKEKFQFKKGAVHEDFGLIPLILIKAKKVNSISYIGYNYVQREGSIMKLQSYEKDKKKAADFYEHYKYLIREVEKTKLDSSYFKSFISNSLLIKICSLKKDDYKNYLKKLKKDKVIDNLLEDTCLKKVKKAIIKINPRLYYKFRIK